MIDFSCYRSQNLISDPGAYLYYFEALPSNLMDLRDTVSQLFLHYADFKLFNIQVSLNRFHEMNARYMTTFFDYLSADEVTFPFPPKKRMLGICRDSALFLCSFMRNQGVPARLRCGYVTYYVSDFYLDGFCLQYYDQVLKKWRSVDVRATPFHQENLLAAVNLLDLSPKDFVSAAAVWKMFRNQEIDPNFCGSGSHVGPKIIQNRMIQDLLCLLKWEPLIWDVWGGMLSNELINFSILDALSDLLLTSENDFSSLVNFYRKHSELQIKGSVVVDHPFLPVYDEYAMGPLC